jgi:hypothetical protein
VRAQRVHSTVASPVAITKHGRTRFWAVHDAEGDLIRVCVYMRRVLFELHQTGRNKSSHNGLPQLN